MCKFLGVSRGAVYYHPKEIKIDSKLENEIIRIFKKSKNNYGTRKIKVELSKIKLLASRKLISKIMKKHGLVSNYTVNQFKVHQTEVNEDKVENIVAREFKEREELEVVVSDLTYVKVGGSWYYICTLIDLHNREIIGYSVGKHKDAKLVEEAFSKVEAPLQSISIFHTDRGSEFKNKLIEELLNKNKIRRSLSKKGCPYDNAVAEATYKIFKTEFIWNHSFESPEELKLKLFEYINWYNNVRIHSSLGYLTPIEYKKRFRKVS